MVESLFARHAHRLESLCHLGQAVAIAAGDFLDVLLMREGGNPFFDAFEQQALALAFDAGFQEGLLEIEVEGQFGSHRIGYGEDFFGCPLRRVLLEQDFVKL